MSCASLLITNVAEVVACVRFAKFHYSLVWNSMGKTISWNIDKYFPKLKTLTWRSKRGENEEIMSVFFKGQEWVAFIEVPAKQSVSWSLVKGAWAQMAKQVWSCHHIECTPRGRPISPWCVSISNTLPGIIFLLSFLLCAWPGYEEHQRSPHIQS